MNFGQHLLKQENEHIHEHIEVHQVCGFIASDVLGAIKEAQTVARGTKC
ncbi:MAG: hypothetical protein HRU29_08145 [Rhizobiales bacterium]|nr:hypothetical protein [Hyphomicrobiales bacterium]NRB14356.1 hypothetical protein [Hyphomicrobiales bacterium]